MSLPGSTEDIFSAIANPKYRFPEKEVPKGSPAFQLIVTNADEEEKADSDTDESGINSQNRQRNITVVGVLLLAIVMDKMLGISKLI